MESLTYTVILEKNEDNGYTVTVPALKGCVTQGNNIADSLSRAKEAIECHVESLIILGKEIPSDCGTVRLNTRHLSEALIFKVTAQPNIEPAEVGVNIA
jgi:predicted RNase H-like HicB family nuclease